jgi:hypothetical protein
MKKVYQTKFGGYGDPINERGNCWQAAVASILELTLDEVPDINDFQDGEWFEKFREWLNQFGLDIRGLSHESEGNQTNNESRGYYLLECESTTLYQGEHHIVVARNGEVVHDPNPKACMQGKPILDFIFCLLDPASVFVQSTGRKSSK